jgi:tRNA threonylcarbamoyladenosine biosynthesis protein TsaB
VTVLAFDTATRATTVALCPTAGETTELRDDPPAGARPRHATHLLPLAAELLDEAGLAWSDLDRVAVGVGPGTFTGLRIGVATARALAQARRLPLVGVSTAASLALGAWAAAQAQRCGLVVSVIDARRGEVFAAAWPVRDGDPPVTLTDAAAPLLTPRAMAPEELADWLSSQPGTALVAGDGAIAFRAELERSGALVAGDESGLNLVSARNHCLLARCLPDSAPGEVRPEYLRVPDAERTRPTTTTS